MTAIPLAPASKPVCKCFSCGKNNFWATGECFMPFKDLEITEPSQVVWLKYFVPEKFSVPRGMFESFLKNVFQKRMPEEDKLSFHMENSVNYEYVRKAYKPVDVNNPTEFVRNKTYGQGEREYCDFCYKVLCEKKENEGAKQACVNVVKNAQIFCIPWKKKPFGSQYIHTGDFNDCQLCWHCRKTIPEQTLYIGSPVEENAVVCVSCAAEILAKIK